MQRRYGHRTSPEQVERDKGHSDNCRWLTYVAVSTGAVVKGRPRVDMDCLEPQKKRGKRACWLGKRWPS